MGSSSVRRDILSHYHQEQVQQGLTTRGRRGRRGRRSPKEADSYRSPTVAPTHFRVVPHTTDNESKKKNTYIKHEDHEADDDDEFFDAEDVNIDEMD